MANCGHPGLQSKDLAERERGRQRGSGKREEEDGEGRETKEHIHWLPHWDPEYSQ